VCSYYLLYGTYCQTNTCPVGTHLGCGVWASGRTPVAIAGVRACGFHLSDLGTLLTGRTPTCRLISMKVNLTQNFTTMVTGDGKTNSYLHRFKIINAPTCPCGNSDQNIDHLLFDCQLLNKERNLLKQSIQKTNN
jgi:hypothetical protein